MALAWMLLIKKKLLKGIEVPRAVFSWPLSGTPFLNWTGMLCWAAYILFIIGLPSWTALIVIGVWLSYSAFEVAIYLAKKGYSWAQRWLPDFQMAMPMW